MDRTYRPMQKECYPCVCCGEATLSRRPPGTHQICPVCGWEDDRLQFFDPEYAGGANQLSLCQAREDYRKKRSAEEVPASDG